jgi:hypothetical protein
MLLDCFSKFAFLHCFSFGGSFSHLGAKAEHRGTGILILPSHRLFLLASRVVVPRAQSSGLGWFKES